MPDSCRLCRVIIGRHSLGDIFGHPTADTQSPGRWRRSSPAPESPACLSSPMISGKLQRPLFLFKGNVSDPVSIHSDFRFTPSKGWRSSGGAETKNGWAKRSAAYAVVRDLGGIGAYRLLRRTLLQVVSSPLCTRTARSRRALSDLVERYLICWCASRPGNRADACESPALERHLSALSRCP
jgi:hypothetical protein